MRNRVRAGWVRLGVCGSIIPVLVFLAVLDSREVVGQLTPEVREEVSARLEELAEGLTASERLPELGRAGVELEEAHRALERYLAERSDAVNQKAWLDYVAFAPLAEAIAGETPLEKQRELALRLYRRLTRNLPGLERGPLIALRAASYRFYVATFTRNPEAVVRQLRSRLRALATLYRQGPELETARGGVAVNSALKFIDSFEIADEAIEILRGTAQQPNLRVRVGGDLIAQVASRQVDQASPSDETILGTRILSDTTLRGEVTARLLPSLDVARLQLQMSGRFCSEGTGYNRRVRIFNRGFGDVWATRVLSLGNEGVVAGPVACSAGLDSKILGIDHPLRLVERIAAKKAAEQKPQSNAIASERLASRIAREFTEQTDRQLQRPRGNRVQVLNQLLGRLDIEAPTLAWSSTANYLQVQGEIAEDYQLTSAVPPPAIVLSDGVLLQLHESACANPATHLLAERSIGDRELREFGERLVADFAWGSASGKEPAADGTEVREGVRREPVRLDFSSQSPVVFEFREGVLVVGLNARPSSIENRVRNPVLVAATYRPAPAPAGGLQLRRDEQLEVVFSRDIDTNLFIGATRVHLLEAFDPVFPAVIEFPPIELSAETSSLPASAAADVSAAPRLLRVARIEAEQGWLSLEYRPLTAGR